MILSDVRPTLFTDEMDHLQESEQKELTQEQMVLNHLKAHQSITGLVALKRYGIMRLAARIHYLKKYCHDIKTELVSNGKKKWAEYSLVKK